MIQPKESWTHNFCLLSNTEQDKTPSQESSGALKEVELRRKRVVFPNKNGNFEYMKHVLESEYEKLKSQDGAFELMRAESGGYSRPLKLILMPSDGYTIPYIRDLVGSNTLLYIRPMKSYLPLDKPSQDVTNQSPQTNCPKCSLSIPIILLRKHSFTCRDVHESDCNGEKELERSVFDRVLPVQKTKESKPSVSRSVVEPVAGFSTGSSFLLLFTFFFTTASHYKNLHCCLTV